MILKVVREQTFESDNGKEGLKPEDTPIIDFYESKKFSFKNGFAYTEKNEMIEINDYAQHDDMLGGFVKYKTLEAYLMNNEGKTIERLN